MIKSFISIVVLNTTLMTGGVPSAVSQPTGVVSSYSLIPVQNTAQPICYIQTNDGKTVDLTTICQLNDRKQPQQPTIMTSDPCSDERFCTEDPNTNPPPPAVYVPSGTN